MSLRPGCVAGDAELIGGSLLVGGWDCWLVCFGSIVLMGGLEHNNQPQQQNLFTGVSNHLTFVLVALLLRLAICRVAPPTWVCDLDLVCDSILGLWFLVAATVPAGGGDPIFVTGVVVSDQLALVLAAAYQQLGWLLTGKTTNIYS